MVEIKIAKGFTVPETATIIAGSGPPNNAAIKTPRLWLTAE